MIVTESYLNTNSLQSIGEYLRKSVTTKCLTILFCRTGIGVKACLISSDRYIYFKQDWRSCCQMVTTTHHKKRSTEWMGLSICSYHDVYHSQPELLCFPAADPLYCFPVDRFSYTPPDVLGPGVSYRDHIIELL